MAIGVVRWQLGTRIAIRISQTVYSATFLTGFDALCVLEFFFVKQQMIYENKTPHRNVAVYVDAMMILQ